MLVYQRVITFPNHRQAGIGKSALLSEFIRFYAMPGDRCGRSPNAPMESKDQSDQISYALI